MAHAAGGAEPDQDEDEECLHCSVCFHKYDDNLKRPKSLPCSHTFCLTCLQTIHSGTTLKCPLCQRQAVGIANVLTLPNNKYVQLIARLDEKLRNAQIQLENYKEIIENIIETPTTSKKLRVIDWGCLGYYPDSLTKIRIEYFVNVVQSQKPDIVFLSRIGEPVCDHLQQCFPSYSFIYDKMGQTSSRYPKDYATVHCHQQIRILRITMLNTTVSYHSHAIIRPSLPLTEPCERTNTPIYNILKIEASFGEMKLILLNTHLRNIGINERELKSIFREALRRTGKTTNVILSVGGGPTDKEIIDIGGLPSRMVDIQLVCDKISKYEFILNDSKKHCIESITNETIANGLRDDRLFLLPASTGKVAVHELYHCICIPTPYTISFDHVALVHDFVMNG